MHPTDDELRKLAVGNLENDDADRVASHVDDCPDCEQTLLGYETVSDDMIRALRSKTQSTTEVENEPECDRTLAVIAKFDVQPPSEAPSAIPEQPFPAVIRDYRLTRKLGQGGMGTVYEAVHQRLGKTVAIKLLPPERTQDTQAVDRFEREMKAVGKLRHPNIVQATDAGHDDGQHYLVMERVDGMDLSRLSEHVGPLNPADACELIQQAAVGLQHAHENGLVHRDVKPSNLMLTSEGSIKVLDLGLAMLAGPHREIEGELTSTGQMMGTIDYMAPEQGGDSRSVDIRADIYSLGASLYKLLTGQAPFGGPQYDTPMKKITALATSSPPPVAELRPDLEPKLAQLVDGLLVKNPDERISTPAELATALSEFADGANLPELLVAAVSTQPEDAISEVSQTTGTAGQTASHQADAAGYSSTVIDRNAQESKLQPSTAAGAGRFRNLLTIVAAAAAIFGALYFGGVFKFRTENGTITIRIPQGEKVDVFIDNDKVHRSTIELNGREVTFTVTEGDHNLQVKTKDGIELRDRRKDFLFLWRMESSSWSRSILMVTDTAPNLTSPKIRTAEQRSGSCLMAVKLKSV